jgi:hypothetical protein
MLAGQSKVPDDLSIEHRSHPFDTLDFFNDHFVLDDEVDPKSPEQAPFVDRRRPRLSFVNQSGRIKLDR